MRNHRQRFVNRASAVVEPPSPPDAPTIAVLAQAGVPYAGAGYDYLVVSDDVAVLSTDGSGTHEAEYVVDGGAPSVVDIGNPSSGVIALLSLLERKEYVVRLRIKANGPTPASDWSNAVTFFTAPSDFKTVSVFLSGWGGTPDVNGEFPYVAGTPFHWRLHEVDQAIIWDAANGKYDLKQPFGGVLATGATTLADCAGWTLAPGSTLVLPTVPEAPEATDSTDIAADFMASHWNAATGADDYEYQLANDAGFTSIVNQGTTGDQGTSYGGLDLNATYYFRVRGRNCAGNSDWSNTITTTLSVPAAPAGTEQSDQTPGGFTWSWLASPTATGYYLELAEDEEFSTIVQTESLDGSTTSFVFSGLGLGSSYWVRVRASNGVGDGPFTTPQNVFAGS